MLKSIPTQSHLARLYFELSKEGGKCVGQSKPWPYKPTDINELICLAADMSRYDPRLLSILVRFFHDNWTKLNPTIIRQMYPKMKTPQTIAVITEFSKLIIPGDDERYHLYEYLQQGLSPVPLQFYFHHLYTPGGYLATSAIEGSLAEYKKWGFLAREAPVVDDKTRAPIGKLDLPSRRNVLKRLLEKKGKIKISDYLSTLNHTISRQQALYDLKNTPWIKGTGHGRGAKWQIRRS